MDELEVSENDRMLAAAVHLVSVAGFGGWGPLIMFFVFGNQPFVRYHAGQAMVFQFLVMLVVVPVALCTFGLGAVLVLPWMLLELWLAYEAWQGHWQGYPGMDGMFRS